MALEYNEKTGHYSRIPNSIEDLLIVDSVDPVIVDPPYGTHENDFIEVIIKDEDDNFLKSVKHYWLDQIDNPYMNIIQPDGTGDASFDGGLEKIRVDVHRILNEADYVIGNYNVEVYFFRATGGRDEFILVDSSDTPYDGDYWVDVDGRIYAGIKPEISFELFLKPYAYMIHEVSPNQTEARIIPHFINDDKFKEDFRLLGYTCVYYEGLGKPDFGGGRFETYGTNIDEHNTFRLTNRHPDDPGFTSKFKGGRLLVRDSIYLGEEIDPSESETLSPTIETEIIDPTVNLARNNTFLEDFGISQGAGKFTQTEFLENNFNGFPTFQLTYETPWAPIRPVFKRKVAFGDDVSNPNALYELDNGLVELTYLPADTELLNLPEGNNNPRFDIFRKTPISNSVVRMRVAQERADLPGQIAASNNYVWMYGIRKVFDLKTPLTDGPFTISYYVAAYELGNQTSFPFEDHNVSDDILGREVRIRTEISNMDGSNDPSRVVDVTTYSALETDDKFRYIRISKTYRGSEESTKGSPSNMMVSISHLDPQAGSNLFLTGFQIESGEEVTDFVRTARSEELEKQTTGTARFIQTENSNLSENKIQLTLSDTDSLNEKMSQGGMITLKKSVVKTEQLERDNSENRVEIPMIDDSFGDFEQQETRRPLSRRYKWDNTLHKNSIRVQNWTPGFNYFTRGAHRGTSTSGYHAHFTDGKGAEGDIAMVFPNLNDQFQTDDGWQGTAQDPVGASNPRRWLGLSSRIQPLTSNYLKNGDKVRLDFKMSATKAGGGVHVGLYHYEPRANISQTPQEPPVNPPSGFRGVWFGNPRFIRNQDVGNGNGQRLTNQGSDDKRYYLYISDDDVEAGTIDVEVGVFSSQTEQKPVTFTWFINGNDVTNESWAGPNRLLRVPVSVLNENDEITVEANVNRFDPEPEDFGIDFDAEDIEDIITDDAITNAKEPIPLATFNNLLTPETLESDQSLVIKFLVPDTDATISFPEAKSELEIRWGGKDKIPTTKNMPRLQPKNLLALAAVGAGLFATTTAAWYAYAFRRFRELIRRRNEVRRARRLYFSYILGAIRFGRQNMKRGTLTTSNEYEWRGWNWRLNDDHFFVRTFGQMSSDVNPEQTPKALKLVQVNKVNEFGDYFVEFPVGSAWVINRDIQLYFYGHRQPIPIGNTTFVSGPILATGIMDEREDGVQVATPTLGDMKIPITEVDIENNTITVPDNSYTDGVLGMSGVARNIAGVNQFNSFEFIIEYTSKEESSSPVYADFEANITEIITPDLIRLESTYESKATPLGWETNDVVPTEKVHLNWVSRYNMTREDNLNTILNFGNGKHYLTTNFKADKDTVPNYPYSVVYKTLNSMTDVNPQDNVYVCEEIVSPMVEKVRLNPFINAPNPTSVLRLPNLGTGLDSPVRDRTTKFENYYDVVGLSGSSVQEALENKYISGSDSATMNVDFSRFENFINLSSVEDRIKIFRDKLIRMETYANYSSSLVGTYSGSGYLGNGANTPATGSIVKDEIKKWAKLRREVLNSFDPFETYMYEQSSSYLSSSNGEFYDNAWPKIGGSGTYFDPYVLAPVSTSQAQTWLTSQITSASLYDTNNFGSLDNNLPLYVQENIDNTEFVKLFKMVGHFFDNERAYIGGLTQTYDREDDVNKGLSKNLITSVAKSFGWKLQQGRDLVKLDKIALGAYVSGSGDQRKYAQSSLTPEEDITNEIWNRILNNMPLFLKYKGTPRAMKYILNCYGIPSTILRVREYGGPAVGGDVTADPTFEITRKFTKALEFKRSGGTYIKVPNPIDDQSSRKFETLQFRFRSELSSSNQMLIQADNDKMFVVLNDNGSSDNMGSVGLFLEDSNGKNHFVTSSIMPVYDNEFYSVMITRGSGSYLSPITSDSVPSDVQYDMFVKKYDASREKIQYSSHVSFSFDGNVSALSGSVNTAWTGSDFLQFGGNGTPTLLTTYQSGSVTYLPFSGSMMEMRLWTEPLSESVFNNFTRAPKTYNGNDSDSHYDKLILRISGDDDKNLDESGNEFLNDVSSRQTAVYTASVHNYTSGNRPHFSSVVDKQQMQTPNLGPNRRSAVKVRIERQRPKDSFDGGGTAPPLSVDESREQSSLDYAPLDSNKVGVYFAPTDVINEDIISTVANLDFDNYIGDPQDLEKEFYPTLRYIGDRYWRKYSSPNNFFDYLRLLTYYDQTLFDQLRQMIPARANATLGVLVEPNILERSKVKTSLTPVPEKLILEDTIFLNQRQEYVTDDFPDERKTAYGNQITSSMHTDKNEFLSQSIDVYNENVSGSHHFISGSLPDLVRISESISAQTDGMVQYESSASGLSSNIEVTDFNRAVTGSTNYFGLDLARGTGSFGHIGNVNGLVNITSSKDEIVLDSGSNISWTYRLGSLKGLDFDGTLYGSEHSGSMVVGTPPKFFYEATCSVAQDSTLKRGIQKTILNYSSSLDEVTNQPYVYSSSLVTSDIKPWYDEFESTFRSFYGGVKNSEMPDESLPVEINIVSPTSVQTEADNGTDISVQGDNLTDITTI